MDVFHDRKVVSRTSTTREAHPRPPVSSPLTCLRAEVFQEVALVSMWIFVPCHPARALTTRGLSIPFVWWPVRPYPVGPFAHPITISSVQACIQDFQWFGLLTAQTSVLKWLVL